MVPQLVSPLASAVLDKRVPKISFIQIVDFAPLKSNFLYGRPLYVFPLPAEFWAIEVLLRRLVSITTCWWPPRDFSGTIQNLVL